MTELKGLKEVINALDKMGKLPAKDIKKTLLKEGQVMVDAMKRFAPKESGRLASSIGFIDAGNSKFPTSVLIGPDFKNKDGKGKLTIAGLAAIMEYGTVERKPRKANSKNVPFGDGFRKMSKNAPWKPIKARPFIRPTLDTYGSQVLEKVQDDLVIIIENEAKKNNLK